MGEVTQAIDVAKGITDYGFGAVAAGAFVVLALAVMFIVFWWFKQTITQMMKTQQTLIGGMTKSNAAKMDELLEETKKQLVMLSSIRDGLMDETMLQVKNTSSMAFDLSAYDVLEIINTVRRENNIANRESTVQKIRKLIGNQYSCIKSKLDCYPFKGQHLSDFMNDGWVEKVASVVESEVYHDKGANTAREHTNVFAAFDEIKIEFYNSIR
ncbi:MAG: hypothetical protein IKV15_00800 [Bacteroidaceae bacterium]|nr:hypothetical protein [Bacteroidaceae bacterium]